MKHTVYIVKNLNVEHIVLNEPQISITGFPSSVTCYLTITEAKKHLYAQKNLSIIKVSCDNYNTSTNGSHSLQFPFTLIDVVNPHTTFDIGDRW